MEWGAKMGVGGLGERRDATVGHARWLPLHCLYRQAATARQQRAEGVETGSVDACFCDPLCIVTAIGGLRVTGPPIVGSGRNTGEGSCDVHGGNHSSNQPLCLVRTKLLDPNRCRWLSEYRIANLCQAAPAKLRNGEVKSVSDLLGWECGVRVKGCPDGCPIDRRRTHVRTRRISLLPRSFRSHRIAAIRVQLYVASIRHQWRTHLLLLTLRVVCVWWALN